MKQTFDIAASPAAFDILANKLYSNQRLAILRELTTNAADAQIAAGQTDKNIILHIPTESEQYFKVRDFGKGLSEDEIFCIYTTFFASTKSEDDSQTGYFGLGSKSPYSASDKFFVTSYQNKVAKAYKMGKLNGVPTCEKVSEEEVDEPDGLEVTISEWKPEFQKHWWQWIDTALDFFTGTAFLPTMNISQSDLNKLLKIRPIFQKDSIVFQSDDFAKAEYPNYSVNVAGVRFNFSINDLPKAFSEKIEDARRILDIHSFNLMAGKFDVTITPSREALQFDDKTVNFIAAKFENLLSDYDKVEKTHDELMSFGYKYANSSPDRQTFISGLCPKTAERIDEIINGISTVGFFTTLNASSKNRHHQKWFKAGVDTEDNKWSFRSDIETSVVVDINNISKTIQKSIEAVKIDHDKLPILMSYFAGFRLEKNLKNVTFFLTKTPTVTKKAVKELTGKDADYSLNFSDLPKWRPDEKEKDTTNNGPKRLGWITSKTTIIKNGEISTGVPELSDEDELVYLVASDNRYGGYNFNKAAAYQKFVGNTQTVAIRVSNDAQWRAAQVEKVGARDFDDWFKGLKNAAEPLLKDVKIKHTLWNIKDCFKWTSSYMLEAFKNISENDKNLILKKAPYFTWLFKDTNLGNIDLIIVNDLENDDDTLKSFAADKNAFFKKWPILEYVENRYSTETCQAVLNFVRDAT